MDPQTQQYTTQPENNLGNTVQNGGNTSTGGLKKRVVLLLIGIAILVALGIGLFFLLSQQKKKTTPTSSTNDNVVLATVGTTKITKEYVRNIAEESYIPSAVTNKVVKEQLNVAVERVLLEKEALRKNIVLPKNLSKEEYYAMLRNKVTEGEVLSLEEQDISWWIPPAPDYEQLPEFVTQRGLQQEMANEIERRFINGEDPLFVAKDIIVKYPVFASILGYNGQQVRQMDASTVSSFRTLQYSPDDASKPFFNLLYSMGSDEVAQGIWSNGSGGAVIKTGTVTNGAQIDYKKWLADQIKEQVKYNESEISKL